MKYIEIDHEIYRHLTINYSHYEWDCTGDNGDERDPNYKWGFP